MQRQKMLNIQKADYILIFILLLSGVLLSYFCFTPPGGSGKNLEVRQNGSLILTLPLRENASRTISSSSGGSNTFKIEKGAVTITDATCNDKICLHSGSISKTGETVVCLPHRLVLSISGESEEETVPDAIVK
ncbi:MAG: NusG domain II-containing protein [Lachnospiraceae bacterium]|nr:NusG domain II-containing protein [Lachnospiraceae bacterium]